MTEIIQEFWPMIVATVTIIIWLIRLESKVNYMQASMLVVEENRKQLGDIKSHLSEIRIDIKWLKAMLDGKSKKTT